MYVHKHSAAPAHARTRAPIYIHTHIYIYIYVCPTLQSCLMLVSSRARQLPCPARLDIYIYPHSFPTSWVSDDMFTPYKTPATPLLPRQPAHSGSRRDGDTTTKRGG